MNIMKHSLAPVTNKCFLHSAFTKKFTWFLNLFVTSAVLVAPDNFRK